MVVVSNRMNFRMSFRGQKFQRSHKQKTRGLHVRKAQKSVNKTFKVKKITFWQHFPPTLPLCTEQNKSINSAKQPEVINMLTRCLSLPAWYHCQENIVHVPQLINPSDFCINRSCSWKLLLNVPVSSSQTWQQVDFHRDPFTYSVNLPDNPAASSL